MTPLPARTRTLPPAARPWPALLACLALGACSFGAPPPSTPQSRADAATVAACRERADQIYEQQNRAAIYSPPPAINTPESGAYAPGMTDRGLAGMYARDTMIQDCVRNSGTAGTTGAALPRLQNAPQ